MEVKTFKSPRLFQVCFCNINLQGDGWAAFTIGLFYRSIQINHLYARDMMRFKPPLFDWRLFGKPLLHLPGEK